MLKTYLGDNLELLALAELGLGDGLFNALDGLVVEFLSTAFSIFLPFSITNILRTYLSTGNAQLNLALVRTNKRLKLLNHTLQQSQTVVLSQSSQEVLENLVLVAAGNGLQFLDDLLLVADTQSRCVENGGEFGVLFEDLAELSEGFGDRVEGGGLC